MADTTGQGRRIVALAGVLGALAVGLGAFGAHGLGSWLTGRGVEGADLAKRLAWWDTAALYHLVHAGVVLGVGLWRGRTGRGAGAAVALTLGVAIFSGTLYAMALGAPRWFGAITPLGGLSLIVGWLAIAVAGMRARG